MVTVELGIIAAVAVLSAVLILASRFGGADDVSAPVDSANWRRMDAEVISMLRAGNRTFLRVRFSVGTSLIHSDVRYSLPGAVPHAGQRVPIRYDPAAPALATFDLHPSSRTPLDLAGLDG
jgi:hypothetical protein